MSESGFWDIVTLALSCAAFGAFGLSTRKHHRARFGRDPGAAMVRNLRLTAWALLTLSAFSAVHAQGWIFGWVWWLGSIMIGAAAAFLLLNRKDILGAKQKV